MVQSYWRECSFIIMLVGHAITCEVERLRFEFTLSGTKALTFVLLEFKTLCTRWRGEDKNKIHSHVTLMIKISIKVLYPITSLLCTLPCIFNYVEAIQQVWKMQWKKQVNFGEDHILRNPLELDLCSSHTRFVQGEGLWKHLGVNMYWVGITFGLVPLVCIYKEEFRIFMIHIGYGYSKIYLFANVIHVCILSWIILPR